VSARCFAPADLEALLYDWHNEHRLIEQQADVEYWLDQARYSEFTLVLGSGTGRIATPLAEHGTGYVLAIDLSIGRLRRIADVPRIARVCSDITRLSLRKKFDEIIVPYSTFQLLPGNAGRQQTVQLAARLLSPGGTLHIDVSSRFDERPPTGWRVVVTSHCDELGETVTETERCIREADALVIHKEFRLVSGELLYTCKERWTYLSSIDFPALLEEAGLCVTGIDRGYGEGRSRHRHVIHSARQPQSARHGVLGRRGQR
jgi:SAM-dependent methyltransferase